MNNNDKGFGNSSESQQAPPYQGQAYGAGQQPYQGQPQYQGQAYGTGQQPPPYHGQSQPYGMAQPYGQASHQGQAPLGFTGVTPVKSPSSGSIPRKEEQIFKSDEWRDLWAAILYYIHLVVLVGLAAFYGPYALKGFSFSPKSWNSNETIGAGILLGSLTSAVLLVTGFLSMVSAAPEVVIKGTLITSVVLNLVFAISCFFAPEGMVMGILLLVLTGISAIFFFMCRNKIPFSSVLLKTVVDVFQSYPSIWTLPIISVTCFTFFSVVISISASGIVAFVSKEHREFNGFEISSLLFCIFSLYWNFNVIENVVYTTVAGTIASFYFLSGTAAAIANPVYMSLRRSMTLSFGSICFGSLILAIIQVMRSLVRSSRGNDRNGGIAAILAECFLKMLEDVIRYISFYAYVHVAIYGKPFIASAKDTWQLITTHGVDVIINDNIVGTSMGIAVLMIAVINGVLGFLILNLVVLSDEPKSIVFVYIGSFCAFLMGSLVAALPIQLITSGVSTTLVCYAENPQALERTKPELYHQITNQYRFANNGI